MTNPPKYHERNHRNFMESTKIRPIFHWFHDGIWNKIHCSTCAALRGKIHRKRDKFWHIWKNAVKAWTGHWGLLKTLSFAVVSKLSLLIPRFHAASSLLFDFRWIFNGFHHGQFETAMDSLDFRWLFQNDHRSSQIHRKLGNWNRVDGQSLSRCILSSNANTLKKTELWYDGTRQKCIRNESRRPKRPFMSTIDQIPSRYLINVLTESKFWLLLLTE